MILFLFISLASAIQIHLLSSGAVPEKTVKSNLVNAYRRFLKSSHELLSLRLNGILKIGPIRAGSESEIVNSINALQLGTLDPSESCIDWHLDALVPGSKVYIVVDRDPCNSTDVIRDAGKFVGGIVSIGIGSSIDDYWLRKSCGPCSRFGCMQGFDWFKID